MITQHPFIFIYVSSFLLTSGTILLIILLTHNEQFLKIENENIRIIFMLILGVFLGFGSIGLFSNTFSYFNRYDPIDNNFNPILNVYSCYENNYEVDELNDNGTIKYENKDITIMSSADQIICSNHFRIKLSNKQIKEIYSPYLIKVYTLKRNSNICNFDSKK